MNSAIVTDLAVIAAGVLLSTLCGLALGWSLWGSKPETVETEPDFDLDEEIEQAAREWACSQGRPELAALLAKKVRLMWDIQYGSDRREW